MLKTIFLKLLESRKCKNINLGTNVHLGYKVHISHPENIFIGDNSYVNGGFLLASKNAKIIIGKDCLLSYNIHIRTSTHSYEKKDVLIRKQGEIEKSIVIEDDCWIGFGVQIMPGVTIKKGSVIGAGAIVTKDTEEYGVYVGIPAKRIKFRK